MGLNLQAMGSRENRRKINRKRRINYILAARKNAPVPNRRRSLLASDTSMEITLEQINLVNYLDGFYWNKRLQVIRLAKKLPTGEVSALKAEQEEALDEDDLT